MNKDNRLNTQQTEMNAYFEKYLNNMCRNLRSQSGFKSDSDKIEFLEEVANEMPCFQIADKGNTSTKNNVKVNFGHDVSVDIEAEFILNYCITKKVTQRFVEVS